MIKKAQLCGGYTGFARNEAVSNFKQAEDIVKQLGDFEIFNPVVEIPEYTSR